jgi:flagellar biosynthesis/type III secretory pathway M-ring protein FliF/YscJ
MEIFATTQDPIYQQSWFILLMIVLVFGVIVLAVILVRKYAKPFKNDEKPKSEEEIAREEVERITRPMDEDAKPAEEAEAESSKDEKAPSREEAARYESERATEEIDDEETQKAMEQYAHDHPVESQPSEDKEEKPSK